MIGQLVGRLLHELGATSGDAFVEVQRTDLVGTVIGATALTTRGKVEEAKGGVIFVDEAYRLTSVRSPWPVRANGGAARDPELAVNPTLASCLPPASLTPQLEPRVLHRPGHTRILGVRRSRS